MDSVGEKTPSIFDSLKTSNFETDIKSAEASNTFSSEESGSFFSNIPWYAWLIIILVVSFLGVNIFLYLVKGDNDSTDFFDQCKKSIYNLFGTSAVNDIKKTSSAAKKSANIIAGAEVTQGESLNSATPAKDLSQSTKMYSLLNEITPEESKKKPPVTPNSEYAADDSYSPIQKSKSANKSGWCYIGEDRGFRSCIKVSEDDTCMSGNIFPSKDICINPSLRV